MKDSQPEFTGFPPAGFRLLQQLKKHNDREWFRERKSEYLENVERPMEALARAVGDACRARNLPLFPKEKNPVMRVYRDIRFSADKTPFKTHVAAELRRSFDGSQPMLYLHVAPERSFVAAGMWQPTRTLLQAWRDAVVRNPEALERVVASLKRKKLELSSDYSLSSMPRGFHHLSEEWSAPYLKLTSFVVSRSIERSVCLTSALVKSAVSFAMDAKPLLDLGWQIEEKLPKEFPM